MARSDSALWKHQADLHEIEVAWEAIFLNPDQLKKLAERSEQRGAPVAEMIDAYLEEEVTQLAPRKR